MNEETSHETIQLAIGRKDDSILCSNKTNGSESGWNIIRSNLFRFLQFFSSIHCDRGLVVFCLLDINNNYFLLLLQGTGKYRQTQRTVNSFPISTRRNFQHRSKICCCWCTFFCSNCWFQHLELQVLFCIICDELG